MDKKKYELEIKSFDTQVEQALVKINDIVFSEENVQEYKNSIADARKLSNAVNQTRVDYEKWHKSQIEKDINKLKIIKEQLDNAINNVAFDYNNWYDNLQMERVDFAKSIFIDLLNDYDKLSSFNSDEIWKKIYDTKFMSNLTKNKLTKLLVEKLNSLSDIVSLIPQEQHQLLQVCNFNVSELQHALSLLESVPHEKPIEEQQVDAKIMSIIKVNTNDYIKATTLLTQNGVYYE